MTSVSLPYLAGYDTNQYFTLPEVKLLLPALFLHYVLSKLGRVEAWLRFLKVHYLFAFCIVSITLFNVMLFLLQGKNIYQIYDFHLIEMIFMIMQYYSFFLTIIAILIAIRETIRYTSLVKNTYSDLDMLKIRWLWHFILAVIPIVLVWGMELVRIAFGGRGPSDFVSITWLLIVFFIYFLSYRAYQQENLLENLSKSSDEVRKDDPPLAQSAQRDYSELARELAFFMESGKIYLQDNLSLYDLSRAVDESPRLISECINQNFQNNFAEWINGYRVEEARARLKDPSYDHLSVEGIGSESGFKSRSAMYAAFKKQTGHSPGHFRQK